MIEYLKINRDSNKPMYLQVSDAIKELLDQGLIKEDDRLPAIRKLADYLEVNNVTIIKAYERLSEDQVTYKVRGSGSYIAPKSDKLVAEISEFDHAENLNLSLRNTEYDQYTSYNFASATPKANYFPVTDFKKALNHVLDRDLGEAFSYQDSKGYYPLRESIAKYLEVFSIETRPETIQIISGAQQGLDIVSKAILSHNDTVIVEAPTYSGAIASFRSRGVKIIQIPMLPDGVNMKKLEALIKRYKPKMMFTMTHCQNPTGYSYSHKNKVELLALAHKYNFYILEDDYIGELIYEKKPPIPIKAMDEYNHVIYIKSFSKMLMPGLRLGFIIVPEVLMHSIQQAKEATDIATSGLIQKAFDIYLRNGQWYKQLNHMKKIYHNRFETMKHMLNKHLPRSVNFYVPKGGILFWVELPKQYDSRALYDYVNKTNVSFVPGELFFFHQEKSHAFRLSIAAVNEKEIEIGVPILCDYIKMFIKEKDH